MILGRRRRWAIIDWSMGSAPGHPGRRPAGLGPIAALVFIVAATTARASDKAGIPDVWEPLSIAALIGGVGILLIGMETLSENLKRLAGAKLPTVLERLTRYRVVGVLVGAAVTALIQSSTATSVILVSLVQSSLISFERTIPVILGANIGTTVAIQILAFPITDYALLLIGVGFGLRSFDRLPDWVRSIGYAMLGLGLAFFGLRIMADAMYPLRDSPWMQVTIRSIQNVPLGILIGAVFTALVHSSAATLGILITFVSHGWISLEAAIPVLLGANIGTCFTAVFVSLPQSREAKRVAAAHTLFNVGGALLVVFWIPAFASLVIALSPSTAGGVADPRQVANAHTLFNVATATIVLPFTRLLARGLVWLIPDEKKAAPSYHFDRNILTSFSGAPEVALQSARQGLRRAVEWTRAILSEGMSFVTRRTNPDLARLESLRRSLSRLRSDLTDYVNAISEHSLSEGLSLEATDIVLVVNELDHIAQVIMTLAQGAQGQNTDFSKQGYAELSDYLNETMEVFDLATTAFLDRSPEKAAAAADYKRALKPKEDRYRRAHIERMHSQIVESIRTDSLHMDILDALRQVNTYSGRIARVLDTNDVDEQEDAKATQPRPERRQDAPDPWT